MSDGEVRLLYQSVWHFLTAGKVRLATQHSWSLCADLLYKVSMRNSYCEIFGVCVRARNWINYFILLHGTVAISFREKILWGEFDF